MGSPYYHSAGLALTLFIFCHSLTCFLLAWSWQGKVGLLSFMVCHLMCAIWSNGDCALSFLFCALSLSPEPTIPDIRFEGFTITSLRDFFMVDKIEIYCLG